MSSIESLPELVVLNELEELARDACLDWFRERALEDFARRLLEGSFTGVGSQRLLIHTWYALLDGDVERLVEFHGGCARPDGEPHYEDIVTTILLGLAVGLAVNAIWENRGAERHSRVIKDLKSRMHRASVTVGFLLHAARLRSLRWSKRLTQADHDSRLEAARSHWLSNLQCRGSGADSSAPSRDNDDAVDLDSLLSLIRERLEHDPELAQLVGRLLEKLDGQ